MRTAPKRIRCTLLNGSAWSSEKKCMRRYKGAFDIFLDRAQDEGGEDGGAQQQKGEARVEVCSRRGKDH